MSVLSLDPVFRDIDRLAGSLLGAASLGNGRPATWGPRWMPVDVYRQGDEFVAKFDLPGVDPASIEVTIEKNVIRVSAERNWAPDQESQLVLLSERPQGRLSRQLLLGEDLETDNVTALYDFGVLTVTVPVAASAKPRKIQVTSSAAEHTAISSSATEG